MEHPLAASSSRQHSRSTSHLAALASSTSSAFPYHFAASSSSTSPHGRHASGAPSSPSWRLHDEDDSSSEEEHDERPVERERHTNGLGLLTDDPNPLSSVRGRQGESKAAAQAEAAAAAAARADAVAQSSFAGRPARRSSLSALAGASSSLSETASSSSSTSSSGSGGAGSSTATGGQRRAFRAYGSYENPRSTQTSASPATSSSPNKWSARSSASADGAPSALAQFIQHKRRMASAPFFAPARRDSSFSPGAGFTLLGPAPQPQPQVQTNLSRSQPLPSSRSRTPASMPGSPRRELAGLSLDVAPPAEGQGEVKTLAELAAAELQLVQEQQQKQQQQLIPPRPRSSRSGRSSRSSTGSAGAGPAFGRAGLHLDTLPPPGIQTSPFAHGIVMTPTTEEWRQLGGSFEDMARYNRHHGARSTGGSSGSSSSTLSLVGGVRAAPAKGTPDPTAAPHSSHARAATEPSPPDGHSNVSSPETLHDGDGHASGQSPVLSLHSPPMSTAPAAPGTGVDGPAESDDYLNASTARARPSTATHSFTTLTSSGTFAPSQGGSGATTPAPSGGSRPFMPTHRVQRSEPVLRPNLTRGSLSGATTSTSSSEGRPAASSLFDQNASIVPPSYAPSPAPSEGLVKVPRLSSLSSSSLGAARRLPPTPLTDDGPRIAPLDYTDGVGPIDPRCYSAITGARSISDFVIEGEQGSGAYGTVRRARERGPDGQPTGPELVVKYVIKQRILADCWKMHKVLGPIPSEVHVLDHLRRVPCRPRRPGRRRDFTARAQLQRRDSAPIVLPDDAITGHPNICPLLDFFEDAEFYYLIMPCAGRDPHLPPGQDDKVKDLFDYVDMHPEGLATLEVKRILVQVVSALCFLHQNSIVHRDIKDENIVLDEQLHVWLIDFGSAAYVRGRHKFDTFSGTIDFASPEALTMPNYDGRDGDMWALGVLLYVMICGECPFWTAEEAVVGLRPSTRALIALLAKGTSRQNEADLPDDGSGRMDDAIDLVRRLLEVDPRNRPAADDVMGHLFVCGTGGWHGPRGWEDLTSDS